MTTVCVPAGYVGGSQVDATTVQLGDAEYETGGHPVILDGQTIGYVRKGSYKYSPPTHRGSRIARYHKQVPEWQGGPKPFDWTYRAATRAAVLRALVADATGARR